MTINCFETGTIGPCMSSMGYKEKNYKLVIPMNKVESGFYASENGELIVVFGGRIILGGSASIDNETGEVERELSLYEGKKQYEIGEDITEDERPAYEDFHPVRLIFRDDKSIDVLIEQLQEIKNLGKEN